MSVEAMSLVLNGASDITPTAKLVLLGIANHDGDGGAWPSIKTLARYANVAVKQVSRLLKYLEERGYITRHIKEGGTRSMPDHLRPNRYDLHLPPLPQEGTGPPLQAGSPPPLQAGSEPSVEPPVEPSAKTRAPEPVTATLFDDQPAAAPQCVKHDPDEGFDEFWKLYPRKVAKPAARKVWHGLNGHRPEVLPGLAPWTTFWSAGVEERFIPHPATWLHQERWNDRPPSQPANGPAAARVDINPYSVVYDEACR